jgi:hypothetical protein
MPELVQALRQQDFGYLQIAAQLWGLSLTTREFSQACDELARLILDQSKTEDFLGLLDDGDIQAIDTLVSSGGRVPWSEFTRRFGSLREMGPGKRDRSVFKPKGVTENLYYRAILGSAFFDTATSPLEFAYIPSDLLEIIRPWIQSEFSRTPVVIRSSDSIAPIRYAVPRSQTAPGHPARPEEHVFEWLGNDQVLDDATTMLAAIRTGHGVIEERRLLALLQTAGLMQGQSIISAKVKEFLESPRVDAHARLIKSWRKSPSFNELHLIPTLSCEGEWQNHPLDTRSFLLRELASIPVGKWWNLSSFVNAIKKEHPDFQRPAGEYDSWFIKRTTDGSYLRGFDHWDDVEGELIRFFIKGILYWLGLANLAANAKNSEPTAFRITGSLDPEVEAGQIRRITENGKLKPRTGGKIGVSRAVPRAIRYQLARYCEWGQIKPDEIHFWITAKSLSRAKSLGLKIEGLLALLSKNSEAGIPPSLVKAIKGWEKLGAQSRIEQELVLKVSQPEILDRLRKSKANRFLGETLGPTVVIIKPGAQLKVWEMLAELGYLVEDTTGTIPK